MHFERLHLLVATGRLDDAAWLQLQSRTLYRAVALELGPPEVFPIVGVPALLLCLRRH